MEELAPTRATEAAPAPRAQVSDRDLLDAWERDAQLSDQALRRYRTFLEEFSDWLSERGLTLMSARRSDVLDHIDDLSERLKPGSVNGHISSMRSLYKWCFSVGVKNDITSGIRRKKAARKGAKEALGLEESRHVASPAEMGEKETGRQRLQRLRDDAIVNLMVRRGLRDIEVARARVGDLRHTAKGMALFVQGKGRDAADQPVAVSEAVVEPIRIYLAERAAQGGDVSDGAPLFASTSNRNDGGPITTRTVSAVAKARIPAAGVDDAQHTAHSLRHTAITLALEEGGSTAEALRYAQVMARHSQISTTEVYAHDLDALEGEGGRLVDRRLDGEA